MDHFEPTDEQREQMLDRLASKRYMLEGNLYLVSVLLGMAPPPVIIDASIRLKAVYESGIMSEDAYGIASVLLISALSERLQALRECDCGEDHTDLIRNTEEVIEILTMRLPESWRNRGMAAVNVINLDLAALHIDLNMN